jgi:hypothetical protein
MHRDMGAERATLRAQPRRGACRARWLASAALAAALLGAGCASLEQPIATHRSSISPIERGCAEWYDVLDAQTDQAGVRDAQDTPIAGFPYLRTSRPLSSLRPLAAAREQALHALADRMMELDVEARRHEIANLPEERLRLLPGMGEGAGRLAALRRTRECARLLRELDMAFPERRARLLERAAVPDDCDLLNRVLGLYPITRVPFTAGVRDYHEEVRRAFARELAPPPGGQVIRYAPPNTRALPRSEVAQWLAEAAANPLGIPEPSERQLEALVASYAPSFEIELTGEHDRFGALRWLRNRSAPAVDAAEQVVYYHAALTRYGRHILLQLVYTLWFPERPPQSEADILAGHLDGLTWRVTLAPDGEPLLYDSMHPCGCFHMFFPTARAAPLPAPAGEPEWAFVPQSLPRVAHGERPVLRVATRTHYIERVRLVRGPDSVARYELRPYDALRSLPTLLGGSRSAFGPDGIIAGTERPERFPFWPMGIRSAGAMRQWGRHATAFVGRRHFDDPDLIEKRFRLELP